MYKKILITVDLDDQDTMKKSFVAAQQLMKESANAQIRLINVQPIVPISIMGYLPPDFDEAITKEVERKFSEIASGSGLPEKTLSKIIRYGSIYEEVLAEANDWGADIIIVGSQKPNMSVYLLGSNAATITRHSKCSVLVVR
jgi:nucleotide-binding universal stress UspA family protein